MFKFLEKAVSTGSKHMAAEILYSMCDIIDKEHTRLPIKHFHVYRDSVVAVLNDKKGLDWKAYHQLSSHEKESVRKTIAAKLEKIGKQYECVYDYYRKSDDRLFLSLDKGIVYNVIALKDNVLKKVSFCLPESLFKNNKELQKVLLPILDNVNQSMAEKLEEQKEKQRSARRRCCAPSE